MTHCPQPTSAAEPVDPVVDIEAARHDYGFLRGMAIAALVVASAGCFTINLVDPDLWGHVVYGQELLAEGLPRTATHTFTAEDYRWVNHENIAEIVMALGFEWLGVKGMLVAKCLLGLTLLLLMHWVARAHDVRSLTVWALLLLVATTFRTFFVMRPQLLSFLCCAVMLWLLHHAFRNWRSHETAEATTPVCQIRWRWLLVVPLLMVLWVNSHGGFVAGLCILGALLAGRAIEAILVDRHRSLRVVAGMTAIGLVSLGTILANPYGLGLVEWLVESLGSPRPEITEWAAPKMSDPVFWPFMMLSAVNLIAWTFTDRRRDWTHLAILLLVGWQSCMHLRHIAFFALLTGFWTPEHLQAVLSRVRSRAARGLPVTQIGPVMKWSAAGALGLAIIMQSIGLADRLTKLPVSRKMYPVDAFDFLSLHEIDGRMVVSFNWAQYALAAFPDSQVAFDGRFRTCYPQEVVDMNFDFLLGWNSPVDREAGEDGDEIKWKARRRFRSEKSGPELDPTKVLEHGDPELVIVDRNYWFPVDVMKKVASEPDCKWTLLYQDAIAQVWGSKQVFDDPASERYLAPEKRLVTDNPRPLAVQWPATPLQPKNKDVASRRR